VSLTYGARCIPILNTIAGGFQMISPRKAESTVAKKSEDPTDPRNP
jgi:hypothetical protein